MPRICVFCGANDGVDPAHRDSARRLGAALANRGIGLVYGGASVGLMGAVADGAVAAGGEAIGVIPEMLMTKELAHAGLTALHVVGTMHERKALMAELSDGFIALPGGIGTFEELFEIWTWAQLGAHGKPCGLLNDQGYYDALLAFLDQVVAKGFLRRRHRDLLIVERDGAALIEAVLTAPPRAAEGWIDAERT